MHHWMILLYRLAVSWLLSILFATVIMPNNSRNVLHTILTFSIKEENPYRLHNLVLVTKKISYIQLALLYQIYFFIIIKY